METTMIQLETLLAEYAASQGQLKEVNQALANELAKLPVSEYGRFEGQAQDEKGTWWSIQLHWHTGFPSPGEVFSFTVLPMCSHGEEWQEDPSCQFCKEEDLCFEGDRAEIALSAIIRTLTEALGYSRAQVSQRNKLARALRSALANKV